MNGTRRESYIIVFFAMDGTKPNPNPNPNTYQIRNIPGDRLRLPPDDVTGVKWLITRNHV